MTIRDHFNVGMFICHVWTTAMEVFLHRDFGRRYLEFNSAGVLLLVPLYALAWRGYDLRPLLCFIPAFLVMCMVARVGMWRRARNGHQCHSRYSGWPRMMGPQTKFSELTCKRFVEPCFVLALGFCIREFLDIPLGTFLMWGSVCQFIFVNVVVAHEHAEAMNLFDSVRDQEYLAEQFREMRR